MRLFLGIKLPPAVAEYLYPIGREIAKTRGGNPTQERNYHLTLHFLGDVSPEAVIRAMHASAPSPAFFLRLSEAGSFRHGNREVCWAGVKVTADLIRLHLSLSQALLSEGLQSEDIPYRPHITLCRNAPTGPLPLPDIPPLTFPVGAVKLFSSERDENGLVYRKIHEKELLI